MLLRRLWLAIALFVPLSASAQVAPRWVVGGEEDIATQLGRFRSVAALPRLFVVLEGDAPFIKVFDYSGRLVQSFGRAGSGPGEFRRPSSLTFDAHQERVLIVDPANARVTVYSVRDTLTSARYLTLENTGVRSVCALGERIFGLAPGAQTFLRELREDATTLSVSASFGEPQTNHPHGDHPLVRTRASGGPLHCDASGNRIVAGSEIMGEVQVFDAATRAQSTTLVPGFQRLTISIENGSMSMAPPETGFDVMLDLVEWDGALHAVTERSKPAPGGMPVSLGFATAPIRARGAEPLSPPRHWRPLAQTPAGALCAVSEPAPAIALFSGKACP